VYKRDVDRILPNTHRPSIFGCWLWAKGKVQGGYGRLYFRGSMWLAHRVAYTVYTGEIPKGMQVHHSCDNPSCCNPQHLWVGTQADNMEDMRFKGREPNVGGERNAFSKLTVRDVKEIRAWAKLPYTYKQIAAMYNVCASSVGQICRRESWKEV